MAAKRLLWAGAFGPKLSVAARATWNDFELILGHYKTCLGPTDLPARPPRYFSFFNAAMAFA
jgi:hypothetical protein